jgi:hypothetical protein
VKFPSEGRKQPGTLRQGYELHCRGIPIGFAEFTEILLFTIRSVYMGYFKHLLISSKLVSLESDLEDFHENCCFIFSVTLVRNKVQFP